MNNEVKISNQLNEPIQGVPEGYQLIRIGQIDPQNEHEYAIDYEGDVIKTFGLINKSNMNYPILRKLPVWRRAKPSDLDNGRVIARFRHSSSTNWVHGYLTGWKVDGLSYQMDFDIWYKECEVQE